MGKVESLKTCCKCNIAKPLTEFNKRGEASRKHNYRSSCKACNGKSGKAYTENNKERTAYLHKMKNIERKYGVTRQWYEHTLVEQNNKCEVCDVEFEGMRGPKSPSVDHNHTTGKVRGIICFCCNAALGHARDNPEILRSLALYIDRHTLSKESKRAIRGAVKRLIKRSC